MAAVETQERLGRSMGFFSTFALGTGTMIGAGIFILPGIAMENAGPGAIIAFLLGGIISIATAISMAELATGMPSAGGSYYYISRTMGAVLGAVIGLGSWLALIFKGSFALIGLAEYFKIYYNLPPYLIAVAAGIILLVINYRGAKSSGSLQNIIVAMLIVIILAFIYKVAFIGEPSNFTPVVPYGPLSILTTTGIIFISYLGLAEISTVSEEVKNPSRNLPLAFIASAVAVTLMYVGIMAVVVGVSSPGAASTVTPLADIASMMGGEIGMLIIVLGALFATLSTANGAILSSSRFPFAMSRDALMPRWFIKIHKKFETPSNAILVTGTVMILLLFLFDIEQLARLGGAFNILIFVLLNVAVIILRKRTLPGYEPTFRDPFFPFTQIVGIAGSLILMPFLGVLPLFFALVMVFAGVGWFRYYGRGKAIPGYSLFDLLENTVEQTNIKPESIVKVLVPISNPKHERDLLKLADCLGSEIIGLHVIKVPDQTSLKVAQEAYHDRHIEMDARFKKEFDRYPVILGHKRDYIVAFDHDIANSIIEQAEIENADTIIMGWHEASRFQYSLGEVASDVLASSKKQIVLLKGYLPDKISRILVAYNGKENSAYGLYLARKLAVNTGAQVAVIAVISPDAEPDRKEEVTAKIAELVAEENRIHVEFRILERYSVEDAILEAVDSSDVTIIGDSSQRFKISLIGTLSQRIARHSKKPVLIVKKSRPISKESLNYLMRIPFRKCRAWLKRNKSRQDAASADQQD
jgi:amino acid transporter/nucleotide-binding universal stress UspA family protein